MNVFYSLMCRYADDYEPEAVIDYVYGEKGSDPLEKFRQPEQQKMVSVPTEVQEQKQAEAIAHLMNIAVPAKKKG